VKTMTYTEEQVKDLIQSNLKLAEENTKLKDQFSKEALLRETAEKKYSDLCERCIKFYVTERDITTDTLFVQVNVPRFMPQSDFETGLVQQIISTLKAERERTIFHDTHTSRYKEAT